MTVAARAPQLSAGPGARFRRRTRRIITARNAAVATGSDAEKRYPARGCGPLHSRLLGDCDTVRGTSGYGPLKQGESVEACARSAELARNY